MAAKSRQPKGPDGALSSLNGAIEALGLAKGDTRITQAKAAFGSVSALLVVIRETMINEVDCVGVGLACADVCMALDQGTKGRETNEFRPSVLEAIEQLRVTVAVIQRKIVKWGKRNAISRLLHAKNDKEAISTWRLDLTRTLQVFNAEFVTNTRVTVSDVENTHVIVSDVYRDSSDACTTVSDVRHDVSNTHVIDSEVCRDVTDTLPIIPGVRNNLVNAHTTASDIHRDTLKTHESKTHASAPDESLPPVLNTRGTSDVYHDLKTRVIVSEVRRQLADTHAIVSDLRRETVKSQEGTDSQRRSMQNSTTGESPPQPPRVFFGRDELVGKIVDFAEHLTPIALIGPGGIGKTSIALSILHNDRIKQRFGDNRRFIRCDQLPTSHAHFLRRLSEVIGAGIENPEDLTPLRPFLSSREILVVLDNAESILGLQGTSGQEIYDVVEELSRFGNICLCITSRISTVPPDCEILDIPILSMEAARDTFYRIYKHGKQSDPINNILEQLDFHPLSITLLATVAQHNRWDTGRLTKEWERQRTGMLHTHHSKSLAAAIELSLTSPTFQTLGPDARGLLGVTAFFPQGVDENNLSWLFPTIPNITNIFDMFCILSLAHRINGFVTMLAQLRDYFCPQDPTLSPLLCAAKDCYFRRLSVDIHPDKPGYGEARWITLEDTNVEHLDTFTSIDTESDNVWDTCAHFMEHLFWHKPRLVSLGSKIERLSDGHSFKLQCLYQLSRLFGSIGNYAERKRFLSHMLEAWREQGNDHQVAKILERLSDVNRMLLHKEGIRRAKEGMEVYERIGDTVGRADCLNTLALVLCNDGQLDAAEEAGSRALNLLPEGGNQYLVCQCHNCLGEIYRVKDEPEKAIHHYEAALAIASSFGWHDISFWVHFYLALLFLNQDKYDDASTHIEHAKSHAVNSHSLYDLGHAMDIQARFWYRQRRLDEAKAEILGAVEVYEKFGATQDLERCRQFLELIDSMQEQKPDCL